jgi:hypothetical protein
VPLANEEAEALRTKLVSITDQAKLVRIATSEDTPDEVAIATVARITD